MSAFGILWRMLELFCVTLFTMIHQTTKVYIRSLMIIARSPFHLKRFLLRVETSRRSIGSPPGARLALLAEAVCTKKFYSRVLEPILADMRQEYFEALREGRPGKARVLRIYYTVAFWWIALSQVPRSVLKLVTSFWRLG